MEPNPIGLPDLQYIAARETLIRRMDPHETAVFHLLENIWKLEQRQGSRTHYFMWIGRPFCTEDFLKIALLDESDPTILPVPHRKGRYRHNTPFEWHITDLQRESRPNWLSMRILFDDDGMVLRTEYSGKLETVSEEVAELIEQIPYPAKASDNWGFRYENDAMRAQATPAKQ